MDLAAQLRALVAACRAAFREGTLREADFDAVLHALDLAAPAFLEPDAEIPHLVDISVKSLLATVPDALYRLARATVDPARLRAGDPGVLIRQVHADGLILHDGDTPADTYGACIEFQFLPRPKLIPLWGAKALLLSYYLDRKIVLVVVYLHKTSAEAATRLKRDLVLQAGPWRNRFEFEVICLWEHAHRIRSGELAVLAPLLILCEDCPPLEALQQEQELIRNAPVSEPVKAELLSLSYLLGLRYESEKVLNTVFPNDDIERIKNEGQIGRWILEATANARAQEIAVHTARSQRMLHTVLMGRFGQLPSEWVSRLERASADTCEAWVAEAARAGSFEEFAALVQGSTPA